MIHLSIVKSCEENEAHFNLKEAKEFMIHLTIVKSGEETRLILT